MGQPFTPPPGATPPGAAYSHNPTDIVGERLGAAFIDWLLFVIVFVAATAIFGDTTTTSGNGSASFNTNDSSGASVFFMLAWIGAIEVVWQGLTGKTPGKMMLGLTTVDSNTGQPPGIGKGLIRTVLKIVDWLPCVAVVGIAMIASRSDHRRVGDLGAGTSVIKDADVGRPVLTGTMPMAAPQAWSPPNPYGQPANPYGQPAPPTGGVPIPPLGAPGAPAPMYTPPPAPPGDMVPPDAPPPGASVVQDPVSSPTPPPVMPPTAAPPTAAPPTALTPTPPAPTPPAPVEQPPEQLTTTEPYWDEARDTYVQWDPVLAAWMQWDTTNERWIPVQ